MDAIQSAREHILNIAAERDATLHSLPTIADPADVQVALEALPPVLPENGMGAQGALDGVLRDVVPGLAPGHAGPRYFGFVTGGCLPSAQLADFLTTIYDQNVGFNRPEESITAVLEHRSLEFVLDLLRLPRDKFPAMTLTSGATESNILGLALARDHAVRVSLASSTHAVAEDGFGGVSVKVFADRPHASLYKAAATVGIGRSNVLDLAEQMSAGGAIGIDLTVLERHLRDTAPGSGKAAVVCLSFGEVNTGDFTPNVGQIRALCDKYSVWLHIDAAFGAFARLVPDLVGPLADGLELADSITSDAHKWLNVPYDCGIFFSRSLVHQSATIGPSANKQPAYLSRPAPSSRPSPALHAALQLRDPFTLTLASSRRFRALPLYTALLDRGRSGYAALVRRTVRFARTLARWMASPAGRGYYEVLNFRDASPGAGVARERAPPLNVLLFRAAPANPVAAYRGDAGLALLVRAINETRRVYVTPGAGGVRLAVSNWCTGLRDAEGEGDEGEQGKEGGEGGDFEVVVEVLLGVVKSPPAWVPVR